MSLAPDDPFTDRRQRSRRAPAGSSAGLASRIEAVLLLVLLLGLGVVLFVLLLVQQLGIDACSGNPDGCDYALLSAATWIIPAVVGLFAVLTITAAARRSTTARRMRAIPLLGAAATVVVFLFASALVAIALAGVST